MRWGVTLACALACAMGMFAASAAAGGEYTVYSCLGPSGGQAPPGDDRFGWQGSVSAYGSVGGCQAEIIKGAGGTGPAAVRLVRGAPLRGAPGDLDQGVPRRAPAAMSRRSTPRRRPLAASSFEARRRER